MPPREEGRGPLSAGFVLLLVGLVAAILIAGMLIYQAQEQQIQDGVNSDLLSIAKLKADQIAKWRSERLGDAAVLSQNRLFIEDVSAYLASPDPTRQQKILALFGQISVSYHYRNVLLVDPAGQTVVSLDPSDSGISPGLARALAASLAAQNVTLTDLSFDTDNRTPRMYAIAPLMVTDNGKTDIIGAIVLTIDPATDLYPLVQSWPVPRESAETLLVKREGDHILYLNELRHQQHTALNLTIPLTQTEVPSVMAVLGTTGAFSGKDYRGVEVISVLEPIPGSPWFMVAKIDRVEAFSSGHNRLGLIIMLVAGTLIGAVVIVGLLWQRRQKYYYRSLYAAEAERTKEEQQNRERLETLLQLSEMTSAGEQELSDFVLDAGCRLTGSTLAFIGIMSPDESDFEITAWSKSAMKDCSVAATPVHFPIAKAGIWAEAVRQRKPIIINDYPAPRQGKKGLPAGHVPIKRFISVPILERNRIVMVCAVANKDTDYTVLDVDNLTLLMQGVRNHLRKRKSDEALRQKTTDLEAAYEEITASDEELRANYEEMARNQKALKASEGRLRQFFDSGLFGVIFWNMDGKITDANDTFLRMAGYSREELEAGKIDWAAMTPPEFRYLDEKSVEELKTTGINRLPFEKEYFRKDGSRLPILIAGAMLDERRFDGVAFVLDITGLKQAEAHLKETNDYLTSLFDYANAPIIVWDPSFRITRFNHAFEHLTGRSEGEVLGKHLALLFPETSRDASFELIRKTLFGERWETVEIPILHISGKTRIVLWNSANIVDPQGQLISTIAQGHDITERKEAEEALRRSEDKYRILFTRMIEGSALHEIVYDAFGNAEDYRILDVNPAFESTLGIRRETVVGKTSREAYGVDTPPYLDIYARVAATGRSEIFEAYFALMKKHFSISVYSPAKGRFATIFEDITDRKMAEELRERLIRELEQKNAELERFTYTVSHDLKSPLITIKGFAGLLGDDASKCDPVQLKKDVNRIIAAADTMQDLLADVLELSRIGRVAGPPEKIPFGTIAREAVDLLAGPLADRGVWVDIAPDLPVVSVDHARIREALVNLVENAVKFLGSQQNPVIRIGVEMEGTTPVFFVKDNGIGIDPRYLERIFNLFERLDVSTPGTGIGLTIVRRIIETHGGKIWAESEGPGKGATFKFTLPGVRPRGGDTP